MYNCVVTVEIHLTQVGTSVLLINLSFPIKQVKAFGVPSAISE